MNVIYQIMVALIIAQGMGSVNLFANESNEVNGESNVPPQKVTEKTNDLITQSIVTEKAKWSPFKVCVLDFSSIEIKGQQKILEGGYSEIDIPPQCTLNAADRDSINSVMQGFVRMIDAWDNTQSNTANRDLQMNENSFNREKELALFNTIVKGESRPMIIGADYLSAYLGRHNDVFTCYDSALMVAAMKKLQKHSDFPKDFMLQLARETGATHLIYGTVSDIRKKSNSFKGYGIETKTTNYQLDVIVKMVDLISQKTVYSNVYTGNYREQQPLSTAQIDHNIFQNLMTSALEQAAEDLYDNCKEGRKNKITVSLMPYKLTVNPSGGMFFDASEAEVFVDGIRVGNGGCTILLPMGKHAIEVRAPGYNKKCFDIDLKKDEIINTKLVK